MNDVKIDYVSSQFDQIDLPKEKIKQLLDKVMSVYIKNFSEDMEGRTHLEKIGINDASVWNRYDIGFSNGKLNEILPQKGKIIDELKKIGVLNFEGHESFSGCIVIPVYDIEGNICSLVGWKPDTQKYLTTRDIGLWNIGVIKTYQKIILTTSLLDAISLSVAGYANVISFLGQEILSDDELRLLKTYGVKHLTVCDSRQWNKKEKEELTKKLNTYSISCEFKQLPKNQSIQIYLKKYGAEKLASWIEDIEQETSQESLPQLHLDKDFSISFGLRKYHIIGLEKSARKLKATVRVEHAGKLHVDTLDFYSARARRTLAQDICRIFEQTAETIDNDITRLMLACEEQQKIQKVESKAQNRMTIEEKEEAEAFGKRSDLFEQIINDFETCGLVGEEPNKLLGYLAMTSRKMDTPLALLIMSSSGAGKSALQDAICRFCPEEDLQKLTSLSGRALFYKEPLSLKHKVLALEEGEGAEEASYAIRNLISAQELVSESTIKDLTTGKLTTMENKVEGPTTVFLTTTNPQIDPETKSRFFVTSIDESREQTRRILNFQRTRHLSDSPARRVQIEKIVKLHRNFQRLMRNIVVKNPYADKLTYGDDRLQSRRDQPKYLNLIKSVAFLRQMVKTVQYEQKDAESIPYIEVDLEDIKIANTLAHEVLGRSLDELSRPSRDLLVQLEEMLELIVSQRQDDTLKRTSIVFRSQGYSAIYRDGRNTPFAYSLEGVG